MAVYPQTVLPDPIYLQTESYSAQDDRRGFQEAVWPGAASRKDHKISFVSGRTVRLATGSSYIKGRNVADQGFYRLLTTTTNDVTHNVGDATNPRIDQVIIRVMDNAADGSGFNEARLEAVPGSPQAGATLDNRSGALNLDGLGEASKGYLHLADVLVPAGASTLLASNIRDRRCYCCPTIPNIIDDTMFDQVWGTFPYGCSFRDIGSVDLEQSAALFTLPRAIKSANHVHWAYRQGSTAITGNYVWAFYDSSGRLFAQTAATAFAGAANSNQRVMIALTSTVDIDGGNYYALFGIDSTNAGTFQFWGCNFNAAIATKPSMNLLFSFSTGGTTPPTTLAAAGADSITANVGVPGFALVDAP